MLGLAVERTHVTNFGNLGRVMTRIALGKSMSFSVYLRNLEVPGFLCLGGLTERPPRVPWELPKGRSRRALLDNKTVHH